MRFVHVVVGSADPRSANGVNKVVHSLAETQTASGHEAAVWAIKPDADAATHDRSYPLRLFRTTRSRLLLSPELKSALDQLPSDTWVQLHSVYIPEMTAIARRLQRRGMLFGFTPHGGYLSVHFDHRPNRLKKVLFARLLENWIVRNAAMIHVIGATECDDLRSLAPEANLVQIPNGYALPQTEADQSPRKEASPPVFVYAGRHAARQKGLDLLLHGYAAYRREGGRFGLVMVGTGKDTAALLRLSTKLGIVHLIQWPGFLTGAALFRTVQQAAAFVHTSRFDVLPTGCLEAAALEVPLLVSRATNLEEYVVPRNAGWVYGPNTPEAIAATMKAVEETPREERVAMGRRAQSIITEELRWDRICELFDDAVTACRRTAESSLTTGHTPKLGDQRRPSAQSSD